MSIVRSVPGYRSLKKIVSLAYPGSYSTDMLSALQTFESFYYADRNILAVVDESGINDVQNLQTASTIQARLQANINYCKSTFPSAKIVRTLLNPGTLSGGSTVWQTLNGNGAQSIQALTGYDALVTSHVSALAGGGWSQGQAIPALASQYQALAQAPSTFDPLHPNNAGRLVMGNAIVAALTSLGVWSG
jgi:hypothetical protein